MAKEIKQAEGFNLLVPFRVKSDEAGTEDSETLKISGIANFCGDLEDDACIEVDLAGEVVVPSGMDVSIYKQNPQILWQHNRDYSCGVCDKITKKKDGIYIEATIHKGAMEDEDWYRVKSGLVTRLSVGFRCKGGEYKEINNRSVYFITKSLLLEISLVSIPASSSSAFNVVKSLGDDDSFYTGDLFTKETETEIKTLIGEEKMKLKLKEFLSVEEIESFKAKGLANQLEEEVEIEQKSYIDSIKSAFESRITVLEEKIKELSTPVVEEVAAEVVVEEVAAEEAEVAPEEAAAESEEAKSEEGTPEERDALKAIQEEVNRLTTLIAETK